ncbi:Mitochondrial matrix iron chaperone [Marasmius tenuissimus]|uniref:ferroxidase n=1 Tax=Marasmius tenuissimus TaxID=585030 RepID=A0ABR3A789_9AGAR
MSSHFVARLAILARNSTISHRIISQPSTPRNTLSRPQTRYFATPPPQLNVSSLSVEEYHELSDEVMDTLVEDLESLIDEHGNPSYEVEYHSGVLTLKLGEEGTYVINKQPPNKQIWLSSPVSGPKRYDYSQPEDSWTYSRDKRSLGQLLNEELSKAFKKNIKLNIP